ncbi:MAG: PASTA domain-containing protein, partial [Alphaproteobacteria bacterium]|nr:PASTA domain-containing protein [Alphaproteobacteria bacterium]
MSKKQLPALLDRHWTEYVLAIMAVLISAISLWIAIDTENTNRELVTEASWPFLQIYDSDGGGHGPLTVNIGNAGVGPAKIETLEVFWKGRAYRSAAELLRDCCGFKETSVAAPDKTVASGHALGTSMAAGTVLRAGSDVPVITFALTPDDAAAWNAFNSVRG